MALSILVPTHVEAKVVSQLTKVPRLDGTPFNEDSQLEPGVHLHWSLPDALTRARFVDSSEGRLTLFPGVPDLWLVVRFNPPPSGQVAVAAGARPSIGRTAQPVVTTTARPRVTRSAQPATGGTQPAVAAKRSWRAWIVDSRSQTVTPLDTWSPEAEPDPESIHTFAGLLPNAAGIGEPGWGLWNNAEQGSFDPAIAAYYPTSRRRFGFHDDLAGVGAADGSVSYSVVGWYALPAHDPLYSAPDRKARLRAWKLAWQTRGFKKIPTIVVGTAQSDVPSYVPSSTRAVSAPASRVAQAALRPRAVAGQAESQRREARLTAMKRSISDLSESLTRAESAVAVEAAQVVGTSVPREIICHGAVVEVPLKPPATPAATFKNGDVSVYPSVKTAMAAVASLDQAKGQEMVEALLQNLDGHLAKTQAGVLDIPAALHALSFQGAPGQSRFYAQIDIVPKLRRVAQKAPTMRLAPAITQGDTVTRRASGHWPPLATRAAATESLLLTSDQIKDFLLRAPQTAKPYEPTEAEVDAWISDVGAALAAAVADAQGKGTPIDPRVVRVRDSRGNAQPARLGPTTDGRGSDSASYWIDVKDPDAMRHLLIAAHGAKVGMPDADKLFELPGPRWYRPWSPQVVIDGQGRSFRFGEDGRFETSGYLRCRVSGETLTSIKTGSGKVVLASNIVSSTAPIGTRPGVPPEARPLVDETALLDAGNARSMALLSLPTATGATLTTATKAFQDASHAISLLRDPDLTAAHRAQILSMVQGREPSPVAFLLWHDPWDPLFIDVNYAHPFSSSETDWTLDGEPGKPPSVEFRPLSDAATQPPPDQVEVIDERTFLTSTIVHTLESALVTKLTLDKHGKVVKAGAPPPGVDEQTFKQVGVLSAPLIAFDQTLADRGRRERTGALRLNRLDIVDAFGARRNWTAPTSSASEESLPWWTALTPRLPYWSRLQFRLRSADNAEDDATFRDSPLCGFLVPDLFEHALEVYDADGRALGQLRSDPPQRGSQQAKTLNAWFEVHPWTAAELGMGPNADPLDAVSNERLRALVAGIAAQVTQVPAQQPGTLRFESALGALMRILDTLRPSIDVKEKVKDRKVRLIGDPIAVLAASAWLECTGETAAEALKNDPQPLAQPPTIPTVRVRIGDQNRPDDGVLGCFLPGTDAASSKFAPVDSEAAETAVLNELPAGGISVMAASHPFVSGLECVFPIAAGETLDLTVLVEAGAGLHAICGVLPRKKITVPREFLAAVERLQPTFRVGPLLSVPAFGGLNPILPTPQIDGYDVEWLRYEPGEEAESGTWEATRVPPLPPVGAAPRARVRVSEGWMRLVPRKAPPE